MSLTDIQFYPAITLYHHSSKTVRNEYIWSTLTVVPFMMFLVVFTTKLGSLGPEQSHSRVTELMVEQREVMWVVPILCHRMGRWESYAPQNQPKKCQ